MQSKEIALILTGTLPEISGNFAACKEFYLAELKRYEAVVTDETIPDAKKDLTTLRAEIKRLDRIRIDESKRLKAPITEMEKNVQEITGLIEKTVEKIAFQVKNFEDKTRELCRSLMKQELTHQYTTIEVKPEFWTGFPQIEELVGISKVTGAGALTKAAKESIESLARQGRIAQDRVTGRIDKLKARCLEAGLETPLDASYVEKWIQESDQVYDSQLEKLIQTELSRQAQAKAKRESEDKRRAEEEAEKAREKVRSEEREKARKGMLRDLPPVVPPSNPVIEPAKAVPVASMKPAKVTYTVHATFCFESGPGKGEAIYKFMRESLVKCGISEHEIKTLIVNQ